MIGTLAVILAVNTAQNTGAFGKVVNSAQNFQRYYHELQEGQSRLNSIERLVFSLVLSNSNGPR